MAMMGADVLLYPSQFAMATGPIYFEPLMRARAIDTLSYCIGVSPSRVNK